MKKVPILLVWLRALLAIAILFLAISRPSYYRSIITACITFGLVSDILDGIIARRVGVSTPSLRRLDSSVDQFFWLLILVAACIIAPDLYRGRTIPIAILLLAEASTYLLSYYRFRKEVATHAIASKFWTLTIFAVLVEAVATGKSGWLFDVCFYTGMVTRAEILAILLLLPRWTNDVPSVYHALLLRKGQTIKRNKWFNG